MSVSMETMFRRLQNSTRDRLHRHVEFATLQGFVHPYLGLYDDRLRWAPPDLVPRAVVADYPTDFLPMAEANIEQLSTRGEQLTRLLIAEHCPEL
jgi:NTE family protein